MSLIDLSHNKKEMKKNWKISCSICSAVIFLLNQTREEVEELINLKAFRSKDKHDKHRHDMKIVEDTSQ